MSAMRPRRLADLADDLAAGAWPPPSSPRAAELTSLVACPAASPMNATGLLISWAIPAASAPRAASRSACISPLRASISVVMS